LAASDNIAVALPFVLKSLRRCGFDPSGFIMHQSVPSDGLSALDIQSSWPSGV
jgi:hypothetical protein